MSRSSAALGISPLSQTSDLLTIFPKLANGGLKKKMKKINTLESVMGRSSVVANCTKATHGGF